MNIYRLAFWLNDLVPAIEEVNGYLFLDRLQRGVDGLKKEIEKYGSAKEAQSWINIVPLSEFISEATGDEWELSDPSLEELLKIYKHAWVFQIASRYPGRSFKIEKWIEEDSGDIGLRLIQD